MDTEQLLLTVVLDKDSKDITLRRNGEGRSVRSLCLMLLLIPQAPAPTVRVLLFFTLFESSKSLPRSTSASFW